MQEPTCSHELPSGEPALRKEWEHSEWGEQKAGDCRCVFGYGGYDVKALPACRVPALLQGQ